MQRIVVSSCVTSVVAGLIFLEWKTIEGESPVLLCDPMHTVCKQRVALLGNGALIGW